MKRRYLAIAAILMLALGLRCVYLYSHTRVVDQSGSTGLVAHNILAGHWFVVTDGQFAELTELVKRVHGTPDPAIMRSPAAGAHWKPFIAEVSGPGAAFAALWALTGSQRYFSAKVLLIALDLGMVLLVYRIALLLFERRRAATIAAALYAVCFPIARQTSIPDPDIWGLYFTVAILDLYLEAQHSPTHRWRWLLACGLVTGVGVFFRPNVLLLAPALGLAGIRRGDVRRPLAGAGAVLAVALLMLVPWTIRNYSEFHRFIPIRSGSGVNLWEGLGELHNNFGALLDDAATAQQIHRVRPDLEYNSPAYDEYLRSRALHVIARHPLYYAELVANRVLLSTVALYESAWMYHGGESPVLYRTRTGRGLLSYVVRRPLPLLESLFEPALFAFAMLALACTWRRYRRRHLLLLATALSAMIPYWLLHLEARYVLPVLPVYLILIALGIDLLAARGLRPARARQRPLAAAARR